MHSSPWVKAFVLAALSLAASAATAQAQWSMSGDNIYNANGGNVGVGTAAPNQRLGVQGMFGLYPQAWTAPSVRGMFMYHSGGGGQIYTYNYPAGTADPLNLSALYLSFSTYIGGNGYERFSITNGGNVGVGTTDPNQRLGVQGMLGLYPQAWVQPNTRGMFMYHGGGGGHIYTYNYPGGSGDPLTFSGSHLSFSTYIGGTSHERVTIANNGYLGIGTTAPASRLHVAGDVRVDGNINAKYQDVAEWVASSRQLAAGTVVVLDTSASNRVAASSKPYDTKVAGVVSLRPGIALGEAGEGKLLVATTGRVRVKVDATRGPVEVGDLLVTSAVEGVAMKSVPLDFGGVAMHRPGTIIGKALEPLEKGTGEILVLLSLQ